jgi:hypothetical protein
VLERKGEQKTVSAKIEQVEEAGDQPAERRRRPAQRP